MATKAPPKKKMTKAEADLAKLTKVKRTARAARTGSSAPTPLDPSVMSDALLAVYDKSREIDGHRAALEVLVVECDDLVREAVDEGERYRDIAAAAQRTVPWVQMSLRRVAGVPTHPGAPIPDTRLRRKRAS